MSGEDLLERMLSSPGASLAVLRTGQPPLLFDADAPRLLGRTLDLVLLAEYARQLVEGQLDESEPVPAEELARLALIAPPHEAGSLRALAPFVLQPFETSARDWLLLRLGKAAAETATLRLGLPAEACPRPLAGETLIFAQRAPVTAAEVAAQAWTLADQLRSEPGSLSMERHVAATNALGPREAVEFERRTGPRASVFALARALSGLPPAVAARLQPLFDAAGARGALQGCLAGGLAAAAFDDGGAAVVCLEETPQELWLEAMNSGAHLELARQLAAGGAALDGARAKVRAIVPPAERPSLIAEWRRQVALPLPADLGPAGKLVALAAGALLLVLWHYSRLGPLLGVPLGLCALAGVVVSMFGGSSGRNQMRARIDSALVTLSGEGDEPARRAAAVALLANVIDARGPASSSVHEMPELEARLGPALETVKAVERVLRAEPGFVPLFSLRRDP